MRGIASSKASVFVCLTVIWLGGARASGSVSTHPTDGWDFWDDQLGNENAATLGYPFGILLPDEKSAETYTRTTMGPIIQLARQDALTKYNVKFLMTNEYYYNLDDSAGICDPVRVFSAAKGAVELIAPEIQLPAADPKKIMMGRAIIGPACSASLPAAALLAVSPTKPAVLVTGEATLLYSIDDIGLTVRTSYSVYNMWYIVRAMAMQYNWTRWTVLTDQYDKSTMFGGDPPNYYDAFTLLVRGGVVYGFMPDETQRAGFANNAVLTESICDLRNPPTDSSDPTGPRPDPTAASISTCLTNAKAAARFIVLLMQPRYVRQTLIAASKANMTNSEYVYFAVDMTHGLYVSPDTPAWQNNDTDDAVAKEAFRSLFVIGLQDFENQTEYMTLKASVQTYQNSKVYQDMRKVNKFLPETIQLSFFFAAFYDAMLLWAQALRALADGTQTEQGYAAKLCDKGCSDLQASSTNIDQQPCQAIFNKIITLTAPTLRMASGKMYLDKLADRLNYIYLYAVTDKENGLFTAVGEYYPTNDTFSEIASNPIPWLGNGPTISDPDCGLSGDQNTCKAPFPLVTVACGVCVPLMCFLAAFGFYYYRLAKKRAITDREWIVHTKNLNYQRHKKNEFGDETPDNFMNESSDIKDGGGEKEAGNSMGRSMGASMGQSMGQSLNMTGSMRKKYMLMGEHFGNWKKSAYVIRWTNRRKVALTPLLVKEVRVVRKLRHENVAKFIGACLEVDHVCVLYEMCNKGPLNLQFEGDARAKLDWAIRISWIKDIVNGMDYLHQSPIGPHTRFNSHCCFIDSRFTVKITDYGLTTLYTPNLSEFWTSKRNPTNSTSQLWTCPEVLRADAEGTLGTLITKEGDVYSFGIILQEIILRSKPYSMYEQSSNAIVDEIRRGTSIKGLHYRPFFPPDCDVPVGLIELAVQCWAEDPTARPLFDKIKVILRNIMKVLNMGEQTNIMDVFMQQMEETSHQLQATVALKDGELIKQEIRSDDAYLYLFPKEIAEAVMNYDNVAPIRYEHATILLTDIVGFETICSLSKPNDITQLLEEYYDVLEGLYTKLKCFKIEHTADSVLVASGISGESGRHGAREIARLALFLLVEIRHFKIHHRPNEQLKMRAAVASGPLVLSVLQLAAPRYGICGELIQIVHRLLSTSECLRIHATASTKKLLQSYKVFRFKSSPLSPIPVTVDLDGESYWLVDEEGNAELTLRRQQLMDGFDLTEEEL